MEALESLSFFILVFATVYLSKMIRQYLLGRKAAGSLELKVKCRPFNFNTVISVLFVYVGTTDMMKGDFLYGLIMFIFGLWCVARGVLPYQFHDNGLLAEMEYVPWKEVKSWTWEEKGKDTVTLHLAGKPPKRLNPAENRDGVEAFLRKYSGKE